MTRAREARRRAGGIACERVVLRPRGGAAASLTRAPRESARAFGAGR